MKEPNLEKITALIREGFSEFGIGPNVPFEPFIYYDKPLDTIRVFTADCSYTEISLKDSPLVLLERNYAQDEEGARFVGFAIEGARSFCMRHGLKSNGWVFVSDTLNFLSVHPATPERVKVAIAEIAHVILRDNHINEVEFPE